MWPKLRVWRVVGDTVPSWPYIPYRTAGAQLVQGEARWSGGEVKRDLGRDLRQDGEHLGPVRQGKRQRRPLQIA
jgi:hypothetical protein